MKKRAVSARILVLTICIVVSFVAIGIGYAYWNGTIEVSSFISTGSLNIVFSDFKVLSEISPAPKISARVSDMRIDEHGKNLIIAVENAYPGYSAVIQYSVKNDGDIPVYCKLITDETSIASIVLDNPDKIIDTDGQPVEGTFTLTITDNAKANSNSEVNLYLEYVQYNESK